MNVCMYIIANPNLGMTPGKLAAQVAHAAVEAFRLTGLYSSDDFISAWYRGGHYTKIVLQADDLLVAERYLRDRGFMTHLVIDEGRTEFGGGLTPTALGVVLVDKDHEHTRETFSAFKLYREPVGLSNYDREMQAKADASIARLEETLKQNPQRPEEDGMKTTPPSWVRDRLWPLLRRGGR